MRNKLIYLADMLIIFFCISGYYQVFQKAGLPVVFEHNSLMVESVNKKNIPIGINDILTSADGVRVVTQEELEFIIDSKAVNQTISISFLRDNKVIYVNVTLENFYSLRYSVIQVIVSIVFIFLGIFVFTKRKEDTIAQIFNWVLLSAALIIAATWGRYTIEPIWLGKFTRLFFNAAYAFAAVFFFHFTLIFPYKKSSVPDGVLTTMYSVGTIFTLLMTYTFLRAINNIDLQWFNYYNNVFNYTRIFFAICVVLSLMNIVHTYATAAEESERRKMRWILLGLFVGPLFLVSLWIIPQIITSRGLVDEEFILLSMLSVPIAFTISIVKHHILNIDEIFKRGTVYLFAFFVVLLIYVVIVGFVSKVVGALTINSSLAASTIAAIVIATLFNPIKEKVQHFVDKKFFHVRYNYREAEREFTEKLKFCYDEESLCSITSGTIQKLIPNNDTLIVFAGAEAYELSIEQTEYFSRNEAPAALSEQVEYGTSYQKVTREFFRSENIVLAFRIYSELNGLLGGLFLGSKKSGFRYNLEDIDLLEAFCHQIALASDRINLQNKLISEQIEKNRLKELNELKSYFVSSVSHELKTPLTSIKMFTELIEESQNLKTEKRNEYLGIIKGESSRLSRLIDNVLDIAKIEKGIKEYRKSIVELNDCISAAIKTMEYQLNLNGFELLLDLTEKDTTIFADGDSIVEVLINLISNSIKYSSKRKKIIITSSRQSNSVILSVEDQGVGIPETDLLKIFQPFERMNSETGKRTAGTGLGLAIVKHIAEAHNAKLEVKSEVGIGSKFSMIFPIYKGD